MVQYFKSLGLALLLSLVTGCVAKAASFDCNKAITETEIAICSDPELSALDDFMNLAWASQEREPYEVSLQSNWLASRNACKGRTSCIAFNYNTHLKALKNNEPLQCVKNNAGLEGFVNFQDIDADFNGDGTVDKASFSISRYVEEFEIRLNVFLGPNTCVPTYSWGGGIQSLGGALGPCSSFEGLECVDGNASLNSSNNIVVSIGYYGSASHGGIPLTNGTYTVSLMSGTPKIIGYDFWPRNITSGPGTMYSFNFLNDLVIESVVNDATSGGNTIRERIVKHDFIPVIFPNGANFEVPKTVREYWETR